MPRLYLSKPHLPITVMPSASTYEWMCEWAGECVSGWMRSHSKLSLQRLGKHECRTSALVSFEICSQCCFFLRKACLLSNGAYYGTFMSLPYLRHCKRHIVKVKAYIYSRKCVRMYFPLTFPQWKFNNSVWILPYAQCKHYIWILTHVQTWELTWENKRRGFFCFFALWRIVTS